MRQSGRYAGRDDRARGGHAVMDLASRDRKAIKIAGLIGASRAGPPRRMLEVGTGSGGIAHYFGTAGRMGWDVDAIDVEDVRVVTDGYRFTLVNDVALPFADASFDVVVSNHVIEHVGDAHEQTRHLAELARVLRPNGIGYLAVPCRWMLVEPHYKLPFLSWLPQSLADAYVRLAAKGRYYDCRPLTARGLELELRAAGFDFVQRHGEALRLTYELERPDAPLYRWLLKPIPDFVYSALRRVFPTLIYTLSKTSVPEGRRSSVGVKSSGHAGDAFATITVTYNPDIAILREQLSQLPADAMRIIVDNASEPGRVALLHLLAEEHGVQLVVNERNLGLAAALNQGIRIARSAGCGSVMLLDQDTEPGIGGVVGLRAAYGHLQEAGLAAGCIGPRLVDAATGLEHGFHRMRGWRWIREFPRVDATKPVLCANLNGSGTLIPAQVMDRLGGLEDAFFIDHVDTEWSFRVLDAGFGLYGAPDVIFRHRMGERSMRFWFLGWRVWPYRTPLRHRYLYRNAVWLLRRDYVPKVWKGWAIVKLLLTVAVHLMFDRKRVPQLAAMFRGISDGLRATASKAERSSW